MVNPKVPKIINVAISSGVTGLGVTFRNRTTGEEFQMVSTSTKAVFDLANLNSGYSAGDVIDVKVGGERLGAGSITVTNSDTPQTLTITSSAITTGLTRGI